MLNTVRTPDCLRLRRCSPFVYFSNAGFNDAIRPQDELPPAAYTSALLDPRSASWDGWISGPVRTLTEPGHVDEVRVGEKLETAVVRKTGGMYELRGGPVVRGETGLKFKSWPQCWRMKLASGQY